MASAGTSSGHHRDRTRSQPPPPPFITAADASALQAASAFRGRLPPPGLGHVQVSQPVDLAILNTLKEILASQSALLHKHDVRVQDFLKKQDSGLRSVFETWKKDYVLLLITSRPSLT